MFEIKLIDSGFGDLPFLHPQLAEFKFAVAYVDAHFYELPKATAWIKIHDPVSSRTYNVRAIDRLRTEGELWSDSPILSVGDLEDQEDRDHSTSTWRRG